MPKEKQLRFTHTYVGYWPCHRCVESWTADHADADTARMVAAVIRRGGHVERWPTALVREWALAPADCTCGPVQHGLFAAAGAEEGGNDATGN